PCHLCHLSNCYHAETRVLERFVTPARGKWPVAEGGRGADSCHPNGAIRGRPPLALARVALATPPSPCHPGASPWHAGPGPLSQEDLGQIAAWRGHRAAIQHRPLPPTAAHPRAPV